MDLDFQLKVHFSAKGVQKRIQKLFINQSVLTKAKLMTTLQKRFLIGGSLSTNHVSIFLDHATNFL